MFCAAPVTRNSFFLGAAELYPSESSYCAREGMEAPAGLDDKSRKCLFLAGEGASAAGDRRWNVQ